MIIFLQIIFILVCISLLFLILIQSGKGQGLAGAFGSVAGNTAQNMFGARTGDVLTKVTGYLTVSFFTLAVILAFLQAKEGRSIMDNYKPTQAVKQSVSEVPTEKAAEVEKKIEDFTKKMMDKMKSNKTSTEEKSAEAKVEEKSAEAEAVKTEEEK